MKLKELKQYINTLPERLDDFDVVNGELVVVESEKSLALINNSVSTIYVDEKTKEVQFLHQSEQDVKDLLIN